MNTTEVSVSSWFVEISPPLTNPERYFLERRFQKAQTLDEAKEAVEQLRPTQRHSDV